MFKFLKTCHYTIIKTLDRGEFYASKITYLFFEEFLKLVYDKFILFFIQMLIYLFMIVLYPILFVIFILPSIAYELFNYVKYVDEFKKTESKQKKKKLKLDKLN